MTVSNSPRLAMPSSLITYTYTLLNFTHKFNFIINKANVQPLSLFFLIFVEVFTLSSGSPYSEAADQEQLPLPLSLQQRLLLAQ